MFNSWACPFMLKSAAQGLDLTRNFWNFRHDEAVYLTQGSFSEASIGVPNPSLGRIDQHVSRGATSTRIIF